jgi:D-alanyl-lipoteichoic acid acyltransferase DltB (MBOAT superfamily)
MTFQNLTFLAFFALFYIIYLGLHQTRFYIYWLLIGSCVFYGWWNPLFLVLIFLTITVDYFAVFAMAHTQIKKPWLILSIVYNIGMLGFFKYGGFVIENVNKVLSLSGSSFTIQDPGIILPIAISFFTFRSLTYTIDYYFGKIEYEPNYIRYATFVTLFPQLISGPIDRASHLLPQLKAPPHIGVRDFTDGLGFFIVGLFKKVVIADYLALYVDKIYGDTSAASGTALAVATFAYTWQIYFDFSGYTDMARGLAKSMGYDLMLNFNNPYLSKSLGEFWQRWHISLSMWFKDYLYIPLGGNRKGKFHTYLNMSITMVVSGLWHGAAWTFVIWGALHALGRIVTRELEQTNFYVKKVPDIIKLFIVFIFINLTWIFFRSPTFEQAIYIVKKIIVGPYGNPQFPLIGMFLIFSVWLYQYLYESKFRNIIETRTVRIIGVLAMLLCILMVSSDSAQPFIYQQF